MILADEFVTFIFRFLLFIMIMMTRVSWSPIYEKENVMGWYNTSSSIMARRWWHPVSSFHLFCSQLFPPSCARASTLLPCIIAVFVGACMTPTVSRYVSIKVWEYEKKQKQTISLTGTEGARCDSTRTNTPSSSFTVGPNKLNVARNTQPTKRFLPYGSIIQQNKNNDKEEFLFAYISSEVIGLLHRSYLWKIDSSRSRKSRVLAGYISVTNHGISFQPLRSFLVAAVVQWGEGGKIKNQGLPCIRLWSIEFGMSHLSTPPDATRIGLSILLRVLPRCFDDPKTVRGRCAGHPWTTRSLRRNQEIARRGLGQTHRGEGRRSSQDGRKFDRILFQQLFLWYHSGVFVLF